MKISKRTEMFVNIPQSSVNRKYLEFKKTLEKIYANVNIKIPNKYDLEKVICKGAKLQDFFSIDYKSKPEAFTRENIVEEMLDFLGFTKPNRASEVELKKDFGRRYPDYKITISSDFYIFIEVEPLNTDLRSHNVGINQVVDWITNKACTTDYGIATDGFRWVLIEFSLENRKHRVIKEVDLSLFFKEKFGYKTLLSEKQRFQVFTDFLSFFSRDYINIAVERESLERESYQEAISKKFYDEYYNLLFGKTEKGICLMNSVRGVEDKEARRNIAQIIVDRLIFIKFIESKGWLNNDTRFLLNLWKKYSNNPTGSFYD